MGSEVRGLRDASTLVDEDLRQLVASVNDWKTQMSTMTATNEASNAALTHLLSEVIQTLGARGVSGQTVDRRTPTLEEPVKEQISETGESAEEMRMRDELSESIKELCSLVKKKGETATSTAAQSILGHLEVLLDAATVKIGSNNKRDYSVRRERSVDKSANKVGSDVWDIHDAKRIRGLLSTSFAIEVNQDGSSSWLISSKRDC